MPIAQYFRAVIAGIWFFGASLIMVLAFLFRPFDTRNNRLYCRIVYPPVLWLHGIRVHYRHLERLGPDDADPFVIVANHQHMLDMFCFGPHLPYRSVTIGKKSIRWIPVFGWIFWLGSNLLIDRRKNQSAIGTMNKAAQQVKKTGTSVFVCPEGTRSWGKGIQAFKKGAFYLAIEGGLPIVPVVMSSYEKSLDFFRWRGGNVIVEVLPAIPTKGLTSADVEPLIADARSRMIAALARIDAEVASIV